jgi:metallo-beta-lactamase family protein
LKLLKTVPREDWFQAAGPIWCRYHDAGHLLGSAMIEVEIRDREPPLRMLFSGDVGRYNAPLYHDPFPPPACDYLICESTYGDRDHPVEHVLDQVYNVTEAAMRRGGVMLIASFAVGRAQQLIYLLQVLVEQNRLPALPIFLDSPMAVNATQVFQKYASEHDLSEMGLSGEHPLLDGQNVHLARTQGESKRINEVAGGDHRLERDDDRRAGFAPFATSPSRPAQYGRARRIYGRGNAWPCFAARSEIPQDLWPRCAGEGDCGSPSRSQRSRRPQ